MCLILFAWRARRDYDLVVAANRDEFYARATAPLGFWRDSPGVLAGRDLEAGGTWMGVSRSGRFAAITNYRDPNGIVPGAPSRGQLVCDFLAGRDEPPRYLERLVGDGERYNGFNLLVGDGAELWYYSNRAAEPKSLDAGVYGLSNHVLDSPWPKVERGKRGLEGTLEISGDALKGCLFALLADREPAEDTELPDTGVGLALERALSPPFIVGERYGTRSSTVLLVERSGAVDVSETTFEHALPSESRRFRL